MGKLNPSGSWCTSSSCDPTGVILQSLASGLCTEDWVALPAGPDAGSLCDKFLTDEDVQVINLPDYQDFFTDPPRDPEYVPLKALDRHILEQLRDLGRAQGRQLTEGFNSTP